MEERAGERRCVFIGFPSPRSSPLVPRGERMKSLMQPWGNRRASVYPIDRAAKTENLDGHGRRFIAQSSTGRRVETAATDPVAKNQKVFCPRGRGGPAAGQMACQIEVHFPAVAQNCPFLENRRNDVCYHLALLADVGLVVCLWFCAADPGPRMRPFGGRQTSRLE